MITYMPAVPMLVQNGFTRVFTGDGLEFTFTPSLGRIAGLGSPHEIVRLYSDLHGTKAEAVATYILACLCDQEDATPLIGWIEPPDRAVSGAMPAAERVIIARHLMRHGIVGKAKPESKGDGKYSDKFDAAEYVAAARVHLGLSSADAEALSMTEFQTMFAMKFPQPADKAREVPTREEYDSALLLLQSRQGRASPGLSRKSSA